MARPKVRKTCFYCKYELIKHNKSNNYVKFNSRLKEICKNCKLKAYKPLEKAYNH